MCSQNSLKDIPPKGFLNGSLIAFANVYHAWIPIIEDEARYHPLLRANAIAIWVRALIEFLAKSDKRKESIDNLGDNAKDLTEVIGTLDRVESLSRRILSLFSEDEQIKMWLARNIVLHGHLSMFWSDGSSIKVYNRDSECLERTKKSFNEVLDATVAEDNIVPLLSNRLKNSSSYDELRTVCGERLSKEYINNNY